MEPNNQSLTKGTIETIKIVISGSVYTITKQSLACCVVATDEFSQSICGKTAEELGTYSPITKQGKIQSPITVKNCAANLVDFIVVKDEDKTLLGRNLFSQIGFSIQQTNVNTIDAY